jgi:hypothetical protein
MIGSAKQSISPREERMHCFVASRLAMTRYRSNFQQPKLRSALTFDRVKIRGNRIDRYVRAVRDGQAITRGTIILNLALRSGLRASITAYIRLANGRFVMVYSVVR